MSLQLLILLRHSIGLRPRNLLEPGGTQFFVSTEQDPLPLSKRNTKVSGTCRSLFRWHGRGSSEIMFADARAFRQNGR